jgi:uncharacterized phage protein (TIGR01671 family)
MKREILFKGKRIDNGEWIYGSLIISTVANQEHFHIQQRESAGSRYVFAVDQETVCQFTGLLDKNGNKIFEGDKVKFCDFRGVYDRKQSLHDGFINGWIGVIEYNNHYGWYLNKENEHNLKMLEPIGNESDYRNNVYIYSMDNISKTNPEITGNIHD